MKQIATKLGWIGTILILGAYGLVSFSIINPNSPAYQILNLSGALGIVVDTYYKKDKPPEILNIIWAIVAFIALIRMLLAR